jgi:autotransporter passenger strand-loop-strand repeat protein
MFTAMRRATLQLGGTGSGTFDLNSIGTQYKGFTTFDVVGAIWTVSGAGVFWNVDSGTLRVASGGRLLDAAVSSGGTLAVLSGGGSRDAIRQGRMTPSKATAARRHPRRSPVSAFPQALNARTEALSKPSPLPRSAGFPRTNLRVPRQP